MLEESGLTEISEILVEDNHAILEFFYDFDSDELSAAKSYANEESDAEEGTSEWRRDWYIPYLLDIAKDNSEGIIEDAMDEFELEWKLNEVNVDSNNNGYIKFMLACCEEDYTGDLDELLNDYL